MYISVKSILNFPAFKDMEVLSGQDGLHRDVKRVSVVDLKIGVKRSNSALFKEGDLFLSSFDHFCEDSQQEIEEFFEALIQFKSSGLILISDVNRHLITQQVIEQCDDARFPLLYLKEDIPYADIIEIVNRYIAIDTLNMLQVYGLQKILSDNMTDYEVLEVLDSLNPNMERFVQILCFEGDILSDIMQADFHVKVLNTSQDIFIDCNRVKHYILSGSTQKKLETHLQVAKKSLGQYFTIQHFGVSQVHEKWNVKRAIIEARDALRIAQTLKAKDYIFTPLSSFQILILIENSHEAHAFYDEYLEVIRKNTSEEHQKEMLATVQAYVFSKGNYKLAAEKNNQHENTVRYRINRLKCWMQMEDDNIEFNETISLAVKLEQIYSKTTT